MNFGTKLRTVLAIATCFNTAMMACDWAQFNNETLDLIYRVLSVVANFIIVFCVTWFNTDYTEVAAEYTADMRAEKARIDADDDEDSYDFDGEILDELEEGDE